MKHRLRPPLVIQPLQPSGGFGLKLHLTPGHTSNGIAWAGAAATADVADTIDPDTGHPDNLVLDGRAKSLGEHEAVKRAVQRRRNPIGKLMFFAAKIERLGLFWPISWILPDLARQTPSFINFPPSNYSFERNLAIRVPSRIYLVDPAVWEPPSLQTKGLRRIGHHYLLIEATHCS